MIELEVLKWSKGDHKQGCKGGSKNCTCGYHDKGWEIIKSADTEITRLRAELKRVRGAVEVALAHFDVGETDAGKDVLSSALEGEEGK